MGGTRGSLGKEDPGARFGGYKEFVCVDCYLEYTEQPDRRVDQREQRQCYPDVC